MFVCGWGLQSGVTKRQSRARGQQIIASPEQAARCSCRENTFEKKVMQKAEQKHEAYVHRLLCPSGPYAHILQMLQPPKA
jgi:hypothetical protein